MTRFVNRDGTVNNEQQYEHAAPCVAPSALAPRVGYKATTRRFANALNAFPKRSVKVVGVTEPSTKDTSDAGAASVSASTPKETDGPVIDRGLGLRKALSDETQSRPFLPLGGEVLHVAWLRSEKESSGKVTRSEAESDRACLEQLLEHYAVDPDEQEEVLERVARGWTDVTLTLGNGYYCRLQRYSEFDTLTLSGPGEPDAPLAMPVRDWNELVPKGWLTSVPGRVFLCAHVAVRDVDPAPLDETLDDDQLWSELQRVTNAIGWERRVADGGASTSTQIGSAQMEAMEAIAEEIESGGCAEIDEDGECVASFATDDDSVDDSDTETKTEAWESLAERTGTGTENCVATVSDVECVTRDELAESASGVVVRDPNASANEKAAKRKKKEKKRKKTLDKDRLNQRQYTNEYTPARWQSWGTQVESNRIVAADFRRGARFYGNYHLDEQGGMTCMLLSPRGASVIQAARQLQRYFTIEQYRLLILARLPGANSRFPTLAKLNGKYEVVAQSIRRMNKSSAPHAGNWLQRSWKGTALRSSQIQARCFCRPSLTSTSFIQRQYFL